MENGKKMEMQNWYSSSYYRNIKKYDGNGKWDMIWKNLDYVISESGFIREQDYSTGTSTNICDY